jgi:MbtH protein
MSDTSMDATASMEWQTVRNEEGRHSLWPADLPVPLGWHTTGRRGQKSACLDWIAENWSDTRPAGVGRVTP